MKLEQLQDWIVSEQGMKAEVELISRYSAAQSLGLVQTPLDLSGYKPDWPRLIFAASVLSKSSVPRHAEAALMVAHAGVLYSKNERIQDASAVLLLQLANQRAVDLALLRGLIRQGLDERLGATEGILAARRELAQSVFLARGSTIQTNAFQRQFWDELENASWISASAPTASGKTYLVLRWLLNEFVSQRCKLAVFLAPTRALVGEIERQLLDLAVEHQIEGLRVASLPLSDLGDRSRPTILVFTQERLHVFLNTLETAPIIDIAIVDEVQKLGDGLRGVILQDAVERIARSNKAARFVFLSPLTQNPETVLLDAPKETRTAVVPNETPTVTQNLIIAQQGAGNAQRWSLCLRRDGQSLLVGDIDLHARPDSQTKRLSYIAFALGRAQSGTLIYANGPAEAEKIAWQVFNALDDDYPEGIALDSELRELSEFARDTIHPEFQLVELVKRGVAFHYGNMPTLLRGEIERLFREGKLRFLVCTSTLVEGVNLACRTILVRGPRKGNNQPMGPHDFWNLAGRAGRWGQDFHGNIVCIDVNRLDLWPGGTPERSRYPITRETDTVLRRESDMLQYLDGRQSLETGAVDPQLEQVAAYLLSWRARTGSFLLSPAASRLTPDYAQALEDRLTLLLDKVELPSDIISRHPGVSAVALQSLLNYFVTRRKPIEELVPSAPESDDAHSRLIAVFKRINSNLFPAFFPKLIPVYALVTLEWMRGKPLGQIIRARIAYLVRTKRPYKLPTVIRETMKDVEEIARFRAPKYLAAYLDVLKFHLDRIGKANLFPSNLRFDLYLEFGVATPTLLSLIGLGLSRTSAVALNEFLANDALTEQQLLTQLSTGRWRNFDLPAVVKREVGQVIERRALLAA
ncbi:MAG TPA: DEAD/DEAH box helicase [Rhizomicrobium sp.]